MIGQIKSIHFPYYAVGSRIVNIETREEHRFNAKINRITKNCIIFYESVIFGTSTDIYRLDCNELVLDFSPKACLLATKVYELDYDLASLQDLMARINENHSIRVLSIGVLGINSSKLGLLQRNPVQGLSGLLTPIGPIVTNFNVCYINNIKYQSDFGLCYSIFYENDLVVMGCDDRSIRLIDLRTRVAHKFFAHDARIWKVFCKDNRIISSGEDGLVKVFRCPDFGEISRYNGDINETKLIELDLVLNFRGHGSKNVWTFHVLNDILYSGGADGGIRQWKIAVPVKSQLKLPEVEKKGFCWISNTEVAVLNATGTCFLHNITDEVGPRLIFDSSKFARSPIVKFDHDNKLLVVGNMDGKLLVSNLEEVLEIDAINSKVQDIILSDKSIYVYGGQELVELKFHGKQLVKKRNLKLPIGVRITSIYSTYSAVVAGCRTGELLIFRENDILGQKLWSAHGANAITGISLKSEILTTIGRDGFLCETNLNTNTVRYRQRISKGWLEGLCNSNIIGFYNQKLFIYSLRHQCHVAAVECSTGTRLWDYIEFGDTVLLVMKFGKSLMKYLIPDIGGHEVVQGSHSMETRAVKFYRNLIITVGEDGYVMVHNHNSVVSVRRMGKSLKCLSIVDNYVLIGGSEQHFSMLRYDTDFLTEIGSCPRISDVEFRVMDIAAVAYCNEYVVATACSDGFLRIWTVNNSAVFKLKCSQYIHQRCVQKVAVHLDANAIYGVSGSTSGNLLIWKFEKNEIKVLDNIKCTQSGIKAMHCVMENQLIRIAVGGDDCSLSYFEYNIADQRQVKQASIIAHTSAVTGLKLRGSQIISASIDERLTILGVGSDGLQIKASQMLDLPDIGDLDIDFSSKRIAVVGHGMEIVKYPICESDQLYSKLSG